MLEAAVISFYLIGLINFTGSLLQAIEWRSPYFMPSDLLSPKFLAIGLVDAILAVSAWPVAMYLDLKFKAFVDEIERRGGK